MPDRNRPGRGSPEFWIWPREEIRPRLLHTMIRVKDLRESLRFYIDTLGMKILDRIEVETRRATTVFVGFEGYRDGAVLEIAQKWDVEQPYTHGSGYGHVALGLPDLLGTVARIEAAGFEILEGPMVLIEDGPLVSFVRDPDGYSVELLQIEAG